MKLMFRTSAFHFLVLFIFSLFNGCIAPMNALIWKNFLNQLILITDHGWKLGNIEFTYLALLSMLPIINYMITAITQYIKQTYSDILDIHITQSVLNKSMLFPMKFFDDSKIYNDINIAISRTSQNCVGLLDAFAEIIFLIVQAVSFAMILIRFDWFVVGMAFISALPVLRISLRSNEYWYLVLNQRIEKLRLIHYLKMLLIKNENIKEMKIFHVGKKIMGMIQKNQQEFLREDCKARKRISVRKTAAQTLDELCSLAVKAWILIKAIDSKASVGSVVLYFNAQESLKSAIVAVLSQLAKMHDHMLYLQTLRTLEEMEMKEESVSGFNPSFRFIEFKNVTFAYPGQKRNVLENLTFRFERGKTYSIVGLNGAGKTTLLKLLLGLYEPTEGGIFIDEINLKDIRREDYHQHISAVFQDFVKYPFSVKENIVLTDQTEWNRIRLESAMDLACFRECVNGLPEGIDTLLMKEWNGGTDISQGQWQKVAIARCYYKDAEIVILDEPFSSVDIETENHIIRTMNKGSGGKLNIFITHHFASLSMADEILVMEEGKIAENGNHSALWKLKGQYYHLYAMQSEHLRALEQGRLGLTERADCAAV